MKHPPWLVLLLLGLFLSAQYVGLLVLERYYDEEATAKTGVLSYKELPGGLERPDVNPSYSFLYVGLAIVIGTIVLLLIMKFRKLGLWRLWYFFSVWLALSVAFAAFVSNAVAWVIGLAAAGLKTFKPNFIIHNLTELFLYSGLAAIFVPILNLFSATLLLLTISAYDMYAVWKSKHMVAMAQFQTASQLFAGLAIPKSLPGLRASLFASSPQQSSLALSEGNEENPAQRSTKKKEKSKTPERGEIAIIGGGDIGFPLLYAGVVMAQTGFASAMIIPLFAAAGLAVLFILSKQGKFYPAMPFVSAGCFAGYAVIHFFL